MEKAKMWRKGVGNIWKFPVPFPPFFCEPKPAQNNFFKAFPNMEVFVISSQLIKSDLILIFSYNPS